MPRPALRPLPLILLLAGGTAAHAQGLLQQPITGGAFPPTTGTLPQTGIDARVGDLRGYFAQAFGNLPPPEAATHTFTYSAGIDVSETYDTDAVSSVNGKGTHDIITRISPSVGVIADSARVTGSLYYAPAVSIYTYHGNQGSIDQNLNAAVTAVAIPDWLFLDVRAYAAQQSVTGFNGPNGTTVLNRSNEVQSSSFSFSPTLRHRFGGLAIAQLGYTLSRTQYSTGNTFNVAPQVLNQTGLTTAQVLQSLNQTSITEGENAFLGTGEDFGRVSDAITAVATQSSGSGTLTTARNTSIANNFGYAFSEAVAVTASIGHEDIRYSGPTPFKQSDLTWSLGAHLVPNPDSSIDLGYGHQQGASSFYLNGNYALTANTHIFATYSQGIGTNASNLQSAVAGTSVGPNGITFNPVTNAPVVLTNNFAGVRPGLFRTTTESVSAVLVHPRDIYNVTLNHSTNSQLESGIAGSEINNSSTSTSGSVSWGHDLSVDLHANVLAQYGVNSGSGFTNLGFANNQSSYLLNANVSYSVSDTLYLSASFTQTNGATGFTGTTGSRQIAVVSLHKTIY
jgi:uncharacterized protein (PEP-CTERM system associated)